MEKKRGTRTCHLVLTPDPGSREKEARHDYLRTRSLTRCICKSKGHAAREIKVCWRLCRSSAKLVRVYQAYESSSFGRSKSRRYEYREYRRKGEEVAMISLRILASNNYSL